MLTKAMIAVAFVGSVLMLVIDTGRYVLGLLQ